VSIPADDLAQDDLELIGSALTIIDADIDPEDIVGTMAAAIPRADRVPLYSSGCPDSFSVDTSAGRVCAEFWTSP